MIITLNDEANRKQFLGLMRGADSLIRHKANDKPNIFTGMNPTKFENELYDCFLTASDNTIFEGSIELISGHKFPDIVINKNYGVEVKTTKQEHWKSTGNSIFESTRVKGVENIYIYFAKLSRNIDFKYRLYQDCLYNIGVTHSPRYMIDMEMDESESIFKKMNVDYDTLRRLDDPAEPFKKYIRNNLNPGEEPWWLGTDNDDAVVSPVVKLFNTLPIQDKDNLIIEALALFPELLGKSSSKYSNVATWLAARHGVVNPSLRDVFSAGGRVSISINNRLFNNMPRILGHLNDYFTKIISLIRSYPTEELEYYWGHKIQKIPVEYWIQHIKTNTAKNSISEKEFINELHRNL